MAKAKYVYFFGGSKADGSAKLKNLLGGKGCNLAEMARRGFNVPSGITITTAVCTYYYDHKRTYPKVLKAEINAGIKKMEKVQKKYSELGAQDSEADRTIDKILGVVFGKANMGADKKLFEYVELDENFNETIKSRHRDEFSYHSFSEGERLRIDLSLLLAWREVARLKNSVNCNLLILDEVFDSSLDGVGTEEFLKLLTQFGDRANIFVISHKSDSMTDKFQNHIVFQKKNNFSRIK